MSKSTTTTIAITGKFIFLRRYKDFDLYESGNKSGTVIEIHSDENGKLHSIAFDPNDITALNKAIEQAKQWVDQHPKTVRCCRICGCTEDDCRQCIEKTGSPCHWVEEDLCSACVDDDIQVDLMDKEQPKGKKNHAGYIYNEHGVCENPDTAFEIKTKQIYCAIYIAQTNSGYAFGYGYGINGSKSGTGGSASGIWLKGKHYKHKDMAILACAQQAMKYFNNKKSLVPGKDLKPLQQLIEKIQSTPNPDNDSSVIDNKSSSSPNNIAMSQPQLQFVKLSDINTSETNHLQRDKWELEAPALKELAESIAQKGVIQPIVLRPNGKAGKYFLVCGERRYQASLLAKQTEIPAFIKTMTEEEAFDLQITENLQRKDVHPMKEAQAYKALMDTHPDQNTVKELSIRFGKSEAYITQRLAFNNLIPEMKKEFSEGNMLIGHAQLFCRLQVDDQKKAVEVCKKTYGGKSDKYNSIDHVQEWIDDEIMHVLSEAPFDKKDPMLIPKAGPCNTCSKQSGGNVLFSDIKEKDRCFDWKCYAAKKIAHTIKQITTLVLTEPSMPVVKSPYEKSDAVIDKLLKDNKVKILVKYDDYDEAGKKDKDSAMALVIAGHDQGKIIGIKFKATEKAKSAKAAAAESDKEALTVEMIDAQVQGIKERTKRSAELDMDKIHLRITERLKDLKPFVEQTKDPLLPSEYNALVFMAFELSDYDTREEIKKVLNIKNVNYGEEKQKIAEAICNGSDQLKNYIIRKAITHDFIGLTIVPSLKSPKALLVRRVAEQYKGIPIVEFEAEQKQITDKRELSAKKRIADLQNKKKEVKTTKSNKVKTVNKK